MGAPLARVDHPKFLHAVARINLRLEASIVFQAAQCDLDGEPYIGPLYLFELDPARIDNEIGLDEGGLRQIHGAFDAKPQIIRQSASEPKIEGRFDKFVNVGLGLHGNDFAFDELEILVVGDNAGFLHAQNFLHREGAAIEALRGPRDVGSGHVRNPIPGESRPQSVRRTSSTL
jgi:hypothetical protein